MSEKTPFDESFQHKMNELPLPDENKSWQEMKQLLDEKEKRRPYFFFRYEKMAGALLLLLFLGLWLMIAPERKNLLTKRIDAKQNQTKSNNIHQRNLQQQTNGAELKSKNAPQQKDSFGFYSSEKTKTKIDIDSTQTYVSPYRNKMDVISKKQGLSEKKSMPSIPFSKRFIYTKSDSKENTSTIIRDSIYRALNDTLLYNQTAINKENYSAETLASIKKKDSLFLPTLKDSNEYTTVIADSLHTADHTSATAKAMIKIKRHKAYFIDAGVGIKQQLPFGGQKINTYNYNGDKALLKDYVPSVYLTVEKEKQWFLQAEFNYAAPRLVRDFIYWQHTNADYVHGNITRTENHLQKTFYNQVPISFNVYLHSSWSAGAGITYNWLQGAVASREVVISGAQPAVQITTQQTIPIKGYTDSFLYRSQMGVLLQAGYQKRRWFAGLRYLQDVQPFITYTLPNGTQKDKLNASFELMIRCRLFRSDKFSIAGHKHTKDK